MRKFLFFAALFFLAACNSSTDGEKMGSMGPATNKDSTTDTSMNNMTYAYTASYSSKFEMGDAKNSQTILNLWKAWDNGDLASMKDAFADTVEMHMASGDIMRASRDSVLSVSQNYRNNYSKVESTVDAFMPLRSTDQNQQWVAVWGKEITTDKKGKIDSAYLQETWRLNNNGKVDLMYQFSAKALPKK